MVQEIDPTKNENSLGEENMPGPEDDDSGLKLTKRRLYAGDEGADIQKRQDELYRLGVTRHPRQDLEDVQDTLAAATYKNLSLLRSKRTARILRFTVGLLVTLFLIIWAVIAVVWYRSQVTVTEEQVLLSLEAPQEFTSGEEIIYRVKYANDSRVNWRNVDLTFNPPRGFIFRDTNQEVEHSGRQIILSIGDVASGQSGELHIRGQLIGEQNETATGSSDIFVTPENFPSGRFRKTVILATNITALPLSLDLDVPKDATSSERVLAKVSLVNLSNQALENVYLKLKPSPGIELAVNDQDFSPGFIESSSQWYIQSLPSLGSSVFTLVFYTQGQPGETRNFDFEAGIQQGTEEFKQRQLTHIITLSTSEIVLQQLYNGSADPIVVQPGDLVTGEVQYRNVGSVGLKDSIVKVSFEGISFDPASLRLMGGFYDPNTKTATWSAATVPELAVVQPRQSGAISYNFQTLPIEKFPQQGAGSKNNIIVTLATFDSPDIPTPVGSPKKVISDRSVISIKTNLHLDIAALYDDGRLGLISAGPLPPQVGQTTSYTIRFRVSTSLNDISDMQLSAVLPDGVVYTGKSYKTNGEISYNERTGDLAWSIPFIEGGTGRARPPEELHIQVAITPGEDKRGQVITFLNRAQVEAVDLFVDESMVAQAEAFPDTSTAVGNAGAVQ